MPRTSLKCFVVTLCALLLTACSGGTLVPTKPEISIRNVEIIELGLDEQVFRFNLNAFNPNAIPLPMSGLDFVLTFSGISVGEGRTDQSTTLAANTITELPIQVTTNLLQTKDAFKDILSGGGLNFDYEMKGDIRFLSALKSIPFSVKGNLLDR
ncbi:MAG: LEA type 2 family protein [Pseudomonadota bacterium]